MKREEALALLGLHIEADQQDILDAFQQQVFEVKNWIFRTTIIPLLAIKRLEKLEKYHTALELLIPVEEIEYEFGAVNSGFKNEVETSYWLTLFEGKSPIDFIHLYEEKLAQCKLFFSQNWYGEGLLTALKALIALEVVYEFKMKSLFWEAIANSYLNLSVRKEVKQAEKVLSSDWVEALSLLDMKEKVEKSIPELPKSPVIDRFVTEVYRCSKGVDLSIKKGYLTADH